MAMAQQLQMPEKPDMPGAFDVALKKTTPSPFTSKAKPRFQVKEATPELYSDQSTNSAFGTALAKASKPSPNMTQAAPRFVNKTVMNGDSIATDHTGFGG